MGFEPGRKIIPAMILAALVAGCASGTARTALTTGPNLCGGEAQPIYFAQDSTALDDTAAQLVVLTAQRRSVCPDLRILLVSLAGDDTPNVPAATLSARAEAVRQELMRAGVPAAQLTVDPGNRFGRTVARGPIGQVLIVRQP